MTARSSRSNLMSSLPTQILTQLRKQAADAVPPMIALLIFLVIWQILCSGPKAPLPAPLTVISETWDLIIDPFFDRGDTDKGLALQIFASLKRVAIGYSLSAIVGIGLGILIGTNKLMFKALDPLFQVLRTVPPLAWLPISLAAFQQANPSAIFVIFITAIWPIIINTAVGVKQIPQDYNNVARVLRLSKQKYFFKILFPATVPYIFTGLKIGIGLSWLAIVAAEMLTGGVGIGFFIWDSWNSSRISEIILALVYVGVVGLLLDKLVSYIASLVVTEEQK
jgi:nitrate/nitrite transport system permease protein